MDGRGSLLRHPPPSLCYGMCRFVAPRTHHAVGKVESAIWGRKDHNNDKSKINEKRTCVRKYIADIFQPCVCLRIPFYALRSTLTAYFRWRDAPLLFSHFFPFFNIGRRPYHAAWSSSRNCQYVTGHGSKLLKDRLHPVSFI